MYTISSQLYDCTARNLLEAVDGRNYFSGSVDFNFGDIECRLTASLIIYRSKRSLPEGDVDVISDIVPVWWEFHTSNAEDEMLNDFSFGDLKRYLL